MGQGVVQVLTKAAEKDHCGPASCKKDENEPIPQDGFRGSGFKGP